ncbi:hypothetical protein [Sphingomonas sp. NIBR02145]|uniref:hypothetical protein n=1 Tax=Sphingomonas sp. NIBR02145 TaxID=3014784 RepID=UPI0022B38F7D|nr:hypothetical protein [Sphingomonas sp. NIBR02145]WHU03791.1 hypothetical protein O3305_04140 [Sphingomonas sp. NIBR02145]
MKAALAFILAAGCALGAVAPAHAQSDGGAEARKNRDAERNAIELMGCLARSEKRQAAAVIGLEPGSEAEGKAFMGLFDSARMCVPRGKKVNTQGVNLRGMLAEALYVRTFRDAGPASGAAQPDWLKQPTHAAYAVVQCAAEKDPVAADRLLRTQWHSPEEVAAADALLPTLQTCANGRQVNFDRVTLHGLIAEALFRARGGLSASEGNS